MNKFIIDNVIVEKSDKDIQTGINYNFNEGFNLICGNNEAGKSSLMKFLKEGFFLTKGVDTGKIFFSVKNENNKKSYRADIKNASKKQERCKLYKEDNSPEDYNVIESFINQKYFEEGFTINLDDLMNLQYDNNLSLINVIKDPSGDKLNQFLQEINNQISDYVGVDGKPKKPLKDILDSIKNLSAQINSLSQKEDEYNKAIFSIKTLDEEISKLNKEEEYLNIIEQLNKENSELTEFETLKKNLLLEYNEKLYSNSENYIDLLHKSGQYDSNNETLQREKQRLETLDIKIKSELNTLISEYTISPSENDLKNFITNWHP